MKRLLFGPGARGSAIEDIQRALALPTIDGIYGRTTTAGVSQFQQRHGLLPSGETDTETWSRLLFQAIPTVEERALALTAAFEGHGYSLAQGNFDGAGITWGIIGFTLKSGSLGQVLSRAAELDAGVLPSAFGPLYTPLLDHLALPVADRLQWAETLSNGGRLAEPWATAFRTLGTTPAARQAQREVARRLYWEPALATARSLNFYDELGLALCFDIQVQNGGLRRSSALQLRQSGGTPKERRELLARLTASTATARWQADVLERKLAIAIGSGRVHNRDYYLANWGLAEYPVD